MDRTSLPGWWTLLFQNSLIYAIGANDVSITGRGMIDGEGLTRRDTEKGGKLQGGNIGTGDKAIALKQCRNILIRDVTIYRGGHFGIILTGCELGTVDNVVIDTNRDGFDIDCCKYLTISNCKSTHLTMMPWFSKVHTH